MHPNAQKQKVVYFVHGGVFVMGSAASYRKMNYHISGFSGFKVFAANYRLAPQNPFPCALIDSLSGYMFLLEQYHPKEIILMGDSAGGNLVLGLLLVLRQMGMEMPLGAYCLSPWVRIFFFVRMQKLTHSVI